jgi:valyl-tRNA synthetase
MALLQEHGSDGVRYWAAGARPGGDAIFEPSQMKVGRRLAIKILNAARFALMPSTTLGPGQQAPRGPITETLDRGMLTALADLVRACTNDLEDYDYTGALQKTEKFFWEFCDDYLELVKSRRYGDFGGDAAASANSAMLVALSTLLRLFAPFLPFVTEEVWSWWQPGSVHTAAWPAAAEVVAAIDGADAGALAAREATQGALAEVRRIKSLLKKPTKAVITRALIPAEFGSLAERDFKAATHIREMQFVEQLAEFHLEFAEEPAA